MKNNELHENLSRNNEGRSILLLYNGQVAEFPLHWHNYVEILYVVQGEINVTVSDKKYTVSDDQILFIPPRKLHEIHENDQPLTILLQYDPLLVSYISSLNTIHYMKPRILSLSDLQDTSLFYKLHDDLMNIHSVYNNGNYASGDGQPEFFTDARMTMLLIEFLIHFMEYDRMVSQKTSSELANIPAETIRKMAEARSYISQNCTAELTLETVADYTGFSKYYFSRIFKNYVGSSFIDYLSDCRISYAKSLFSNPQMSITEIAMQSGFGSIASFNRVFQKQEGCSPSDFRSMHRF